MSINAEVHRARRVRDKTRGLGFTTPDAWYPADPTAKERSLRCGLQKAQALGGITVLGAGLGPDDGLWRRGGVVGMTSMECGQRLAAGYGAYY
jgi:hypothetical protein